MLKFKKDGKEVGVLKDSATEPEGEAFEYKIQDNNHIEPASEEEKEEPEEIKEEVTDESVG